MNPFTGTPFEEFLDLFLEGYVAGLSDADLTTIHAELSQTIEDVAAAPLEFTSDEFSVAQLLDVTKIAAGKRDALAAEIKRRGDAAAAAAEFAALATAEVEAEEPEVEPEVEEPEVEETEEKPEEEAAAVVASTGPLPIPSFSRSLTETRPAAGRPVALVAAGGARDSTPGTPFESELALAEAFIRRHATFGSSGPDVHESFAIAKADWRDHYPRERTLGKDEELNWETIRPIINQDSIRKAMADRVHEQDKGLVASGGLCAPVTPYYNLMFISTPTRPVMASLPSFSADRGGLRYARPAALSAITTAIGAITEANDSLGGTYATKTCQTIACPAFEETDVTTFYHCLQFGNLGARTFPELVAQWNNLVLAAQARQAESALLTMIDAASTQVTASNAMGLGASAQLFNQILAAGDAMRSRHRMATDAVLRLMLPWWAVDLIVSDVIRTQFERFDTDQAKVTALLRSFNIEPTFYIDGANGKAQVFGSQSAGALLTFPPTVTWYLFPEGSFLYLDGGTLELGIVRDSVLNRTNDFQIFGETFENVAFIGVESLAVTSTVCDTGTVSLPHAVTSCSYS